MNSEIWPVAVFGGLAGAILNQVWIGFRTWRKRPILRVEFDERVDGCVVDNVRFKRSNTLVEGTRKYLRLRVFNHGSTTARDAQVMLVHLSNPKSGWALDGEVLDALWSSCEGAVKMDIPSQSPRYADICCAEHASAEVGLMICAANGNIDGLRQVDAKGTIYFDVYVAAQDAKTVKNRFAFQFEGTAAGLQIIRDA